jgi:hypothetical protein
MLNGIEWILWELKVIENTCNGFGNKVLTLAVNCGMEKVKKENWTLLFLDT